MARAPLSLKARAIGLLAQREHSRTELRRKLLLIERRMRELQARAADARGSCPGRSGRARHGGRATDETLAGAAAAFDDGTFDAPTFDEPALHDRPPGGTDSGSPRFGDPTAEAWSSVEGSENDSSPGDGPTDEMDTGANTAHLDAADASEAGAAAVDALLDALAADGYLDDNRFIESRLNLRAGRFGAQRIQQELARHGLRLDAEQQAQLRASELERAREVWLRRFGPQPSTELPEQARQTRFLLARGFAADVVWRVLRNVR